MHYIHNIQCAPIKNNPLEKIMYFSRGSTDLSQTFRLCIHATYPANFIERTYMVQKIQQFKL